MDEDEAEAEVAAAAAAAESSRVELRSGEANRRRPPETDAPERDAPEMDVPETAEMAEMVPEATPYLAPPEPVGD